MPTMEHYLYFHRCFSERINANIIRSCRLIFIKELKKIIVMAQLLTHFAVKWNKQTNRDTDLFFFDLETYHFLTSEIQ